MSKKNDSKPTVGHEDAATPSSTMVSVRFSEEELAQVKQAAKHGATLSHLSDLLSKCAAKIASSHVATKAFLINQCDLLEAELCNEQNLASHLAAGRKAAKTMQAWLYKYEHQQTILEKALSSLVSTLEDESKTIYLGTLKVHVALGTMIKIAGDDAHRPRIGSR